MSKIVPRNSYCDNLNHMCSPQGVKFNIVPKIYNTCEKKLPLAVLSRNTKVITDTAAARACPNMTPGEKTLSNCPNQVQYKMHRDTPKQFRSLIMSTAVLGRCAIWQGTLVSILCTSNMLQSGQAMARHFGFYSVHVKHVANRPSYFSQSDTRQTGRLKATN